MNKLIFLLTAALFIAACAPIAQENATACPADAKLCPDGSSVGREGPNCEFATCPEDAAEDLGTFKQYMSQSNEKCMLMRYSCDSGEAFSDETGCGCITPHNSAPVTLCPTDYDPVCGWFDESIKCFAYPCAETYSNLCLASINVNVASTTPGECPTPTTGNTTEKTYIKEGPACVITFACAQGQRAFRDERGCGCKDVIAVEQKLVLKPMLCQPLPWDAWYSANKNNYSLYKIATPPESQIITDYYANIGVSVKEVKKVGTNPTCNACDVCTAPYAYSLTTAGDTSQLESEGWVVSSDIIACPDVRQSACTREYLPVCGEKTLNTGETTTQTYGNKCEACADMKVTGYTPGECTATEDESPQLTGQKEYIKKGPNCVINFMCIKGKQAFKDHEGCGCQAATSEETSEEPQAAQEPTQGKMMAADCTDPRPEFCTMQYDPVCGQETDGTTTTYSNSCSACSDSDTVSWYAGKCPQDPVGNTNPYN